MGQEGFHDSPLDGGATPPSSRPLQMGGYVKAEVASDTLVALSRNHFSMVMYELQHHLKPLNLTDEFVIITLAKLANGNGRRPRVLSPGSGPAGRPGARCRSLPLSSLTSPISLSASF